jgi:hypothetical protein
LILGDFNARLGHGRLGEQDTIGPCTFGREAVHQVEVPNRDLLLEFCIEAELVIMSTFIDRPCYEKFTFVEAGASFSGDISESTHNMLDLVLCEACHTEQVRDIQGVRQAA